jgi:hypothetical protein
MVELHLGMQVLWGRQGGDLMSQHTEGVGLISLRSIVSRVYRPPRLRAHRSCRSARTHSALSFGERVGSKRTDAEYRRGPGTRRA